MAKRLASTPFAEILPPNLAQGMGTAASSLDGILARSCRAIPAILFYAQLARDSGFEDPVDMLAPLRRLADGALDRLPEPVLDLLAWQLHVDGYETAVDRQAKLRMVQMSLMLHRRKGTPWSVIHALEAAFACPAELSEWFTYGGRPYFFRVAIDVSDAYWGEAFSPNAWKLIYDHKNVRSWLEYLTTRARTPLTEYVAVAARSLTKARPHLWFAPKAPPSLARNPGVTARTLTVSRQSFWSPPAPCAATGRGVAASASGRTTTALGLFFPDRVLALARGKGSCAHGHPLTRISRREHA